MLKDIGNMMKLQKELKSMQKALKKAEASAESQDGNIKVTVNGEFNIVGIKIHESLLSPENKEKLEKQLLSVINKAIENSQEYARKEMKKLTGGLNIPGLDNLLG